MSAKTGIEWTRGDDGKPGATWNPVTGCSDVSDGCALCYARTFAERWRGTPGHYFEQGFDVVLRPDKLDLPLRWKRSRRIFVNSMSDLFHARVPRPFLAQVFRTMARTPQHQYLILTKRPERMARLVGDKFDGGVQLLEELTVESEYMDLWGAVWPLENVELGTSIESDEHVGRADHLRATDAATRFLSLEPLLGPLPSLDLTGINQVIIGGESGPGSREMDLGWVRELIAMARDAGTAVFIKQLGKVWAGSGKGGDWDLWPEDLRIREFPAVDEAVTTP